ncbi:MAG: M36 family metallopeptidase, partial [Nannocystaceae bacterium]
TMAAITQLFYTVNWLHDYWYDSGFDEEAGNAQIDNYERGGVEGDVLLAEAQDAALEGARNNANMSTPGDGESPRMQMYLATAGTSSVTIEPLAETYPVGNAGFGPTSFDVTAPVALIDDGVDPIGDGCEPAINNLAGQIALIDRGSCSFETKINHAEDAGALGVLIANNQPGNNPPGLGADNDMEDPTIPGLGISNNAGNDIKAALENDPQTAHMLRENQVERDGTIDNGIVAHELGHYVHNRLVENGTVATRSQGEGWGDFLALHMSLHEGDDLDAVYPFPHYGAFFSDQTGYFGYRRIPYSVDQTKNSLSFRHISEGEDVPQNHPFKNNGITNAEVHNAGEVWATMMWESYVAILKSYEEGDKTFDEGRRAMSDYIVAGMVLAPAFPTYTEQRDAILMAIAASEPDDF